MFRNTVHKFFAKMSRPCTLVFRFAIVYVSKVPYKSIRRYVTFKVCHEYIYMSHAPSRKKKKTKQKKNGSYITLHYIMLLKRA